MNTRADSGAGVLVVCGMLTLPTIVLAQSASSTNTLEEVVVSARQREERLSDVPATVQVFTAQEIKFAGVELTISLGSGGA
jgi:outer membrane receptor protein involved in Fe transport